MTDAVGTVESGRTQRPDKVRVWDLFVRLFHWSLVSLFVFAYFTGDEWQNAHEWAGYAIAALIVVRIAWGFVGSEHARFSSFLYKPKTIVSFLKASIGMRARRYLGHNPAGGAMVIALLAAITVISVSGHMMTMDTYWGVGWVEDLHKITVNLTLLLIIFHVGGVILASVEHKENLVKSMFTGSKRR